MPELYMQTEEVRSAAMKLQQMANELQEQSHRLNSSLHYLQSNWQSPGQAMFTGEMAHALQTINWLADSGHTLSQRVQAEVDEWLAVDAQFGNSAVSWSPIGSVDEWDDYTKYLPGLGTFAGLLLDIFGITSGPLAHSPLIIDLFQQWHNDTIEYGDRPSALAAAMVLDTMIIASTGGVSDVIGTKVGAAIGTLAFGPAGTVIGGVAGNFVASWIADIAVNELYLESKMRTEMIEDFASNIDSLANKGAEIISMLDSAVEAIQDVELPALSPTL